MRRRRVSEPARPRRSTRRPASLTFSGRRRISPPEAPLPRANRRRRATKKTTPRCKRGYVKKKVKRKTECVEPGRRPSRPSRPGAVAMRQLNEALPDSCLALVPWLLFAAYAALLRRLAAETGPQWTVTAVSAPTNFTPGNASGEDVYRVQVTNTGDAASNGGTGHDLQTMRARRLGARAGAVRPAQTSCVADADSGNLCAGNFRCVLTSCTYTGTVVPEDTFDRDVPGGCRCQSEPGSVLRTWCVSPVVARPTRRSAPPTAICRAPGWFW